MPTTASRCGKASRGRLENNGIDFSHEERIIRPDGGIRHLQSVGEVVRDDAGAPIRMLGVCPTSLRGAGRGALRDSEQELPFPAQGRARLRHLHAGCGRPREKLGRGAARITGYSDSEIIGRHFEIFLPKNRGPPGLGEQALVAAIEHGQFEEQTWLERKDGSRFFASVVMDAIRDDAGELVGFAKLVRDITVQHDAQLRNWSKRANSWRSRRRWRRSAS